MHEGHEWVLYVTFYPSLPQLCGVLEGTTWEKMLMVSDPLFLPLLYGGHLEALQPTSVLYLPDCLKFLKAVAGPEAHKTTPSTYFSVALWLHPSTSVRWHQQQQVFYSTSLLALLDIKNRVAHALIGVEIAASRNLEMSADFWLMGRCSPLVLINNFFNVLQHTKR